MNPVDSSGRRIPVLPPAVVADDWREHAAFRETFLFGFTSPHHNGALRGLGAMLTEIQGEGAGDPIFPMPPGIYIAHELRAVIGDLRHLQGFLIEAAEASGEGLTLEWAEDAEAWRLCKLARRMARRVKGVADALDREIEPGKEA